MFDPAVSKIKSSSYLHHLGLELVGLLFYLCFLFFPQDVTATERLLCLSFWIKDKFFIENRREGEDHGVGFCDSNNKKDGDEDA